MSSLITIICILFSLFYPSLNLTFAYPLSHKLAKFWSDYVTKICSLRLFAILRTYKKFYFLGDYESKKMLPEQYLLISNHQSLLDVPVYLKFMHEKEMCFVAKDTLASVPMVGPMLKSQGHCMIPRKGRASQAMKILTKFGENVKKDKNKMPVIFPEGTRSKDGELGQFYSAGFRKISETVNLPVAVCALDGGWKIRSFDQIMRNLYKGCYRVKVLKVFDPPKTKEEHTKILEEARKLIDAQLKEWRALPSDSMQV